MRSGSMLSRFMRWFEGISLAEENLARERAILAGRDIEAGLTKKSLTGATVGGSALAFDPAGLKNNVTLAGGAPPAPAFLPVSYLEGHGYYRAGGDDAAKASKDHSLQGASAATLATAGLAQKREDSMGTGAEPLRADQRFEHDSTVRIHPPTVEEQLRAQQALQLQQQQRGGMLGGPETVAAGGGVSYDRDSGYPALHNAQLAVPVLVPGEQARQERREIEIEHGRVPVQ